jgi:hypothetical protein
MDCMLNYIHDPILRMNTLHHHTIGEPWSDHVKEDTPMTQQYLG